METCDVHTILRLPTGLFYAQGVKSNVIFFDKLRPRCIPAGTCWVYDLRSDSRFTLKARPIQPSDLAEFVKFYCAGDLGARSSVPRSARWRAFQHDEIIRSEGCRLDMQWNADESVQAVASVSRLNDIADQITADLERALAHISRVTGRK